MNVKPQLCFKSPRMLAGAPKPSPRITRPADPAPGSLPALPARRRRGFCLRFPSRPSKRDTLASHKLFKTFQVVSSIPFCLVKNGTDLEEGEGVRVRPGRASRAGPGGVSGQQQPRGGAFGDEERASRPVRGGSFYANFHVLEGEHARASTNIPETKSYP